MKNGAFFLWRAVNSIMEQTFKDYEIIIVKEGSMPINTNAGIRKARGELVKILYMDDYFAHTDALREIVDNFKGHWMITGTDTNPHPQWTDDIETGNNKLGSPSALTFRNQGYYSYDFEWIVSEDILFDERMSWLLDCDLYKRLEKRFGKPKILDSVNVCLGIGDHQMTNILTDEEKLLEHKIIRKKYE